MFGRLVCTLIVALAARSHAAEAEPALPPSAPPVPPRDPPRLLHPANGTIVQQGRRVVVDFIVASSDVLQRGYICVRVAGGAWGCFGDPGAIWLVAPTPTSSLLLEIALSSRGAADGVTTEAATAAIQRATAGTQAPSRPGIDPATGAGSVGWYDFTVFAVEAADTCAGVDAHNATATPTNPLGIPGWRAYSRCYSRAGISTATSAPETMWQRGYSAATLAAPVQLCAGVGHFRFFLYEPDELPLPTRQAAELYAIFAASPYRTLVQGEACAFFYVNDLRVANAFAADWIMARRIITRLPFWGAAGERHVLFDFADHATPYDVGRAIVVRSSFGTPIDAKFYNAADPDSVPQMWPHRPGHDLVAPMPFYRGNMGDFTHLHKFDAQVASGAIPEVQGRDLTLVFKGAIYATPPAHHARVRETLAQVHNGDDVIIAVTCSSPAMSLLPCHFATPGSTFATSTSEQGCPPPKPTVTTTNPGDVRCAQWDAAAAAIDYDQLLLRAKFAAIAPGEGTHSYRLYEALQAGAIPVLLGDSVAPLHHLLPWERFAVIQRDVSLPALRNLVTNLRGAPADLLADLRTVGRLVFRSNFASLQLQANSIIAEMALMFRAVHLAERALVEAAAGAPTLPSATNVTDTAPLQPPPDRAFDLDRQVAAKIQAHTEELARQAAERTATPRPLRLSATTSRIPQAAPEKTVSVTTAGPSRDHPSEREVLDVLPPPPQLEAPTHEPGQPPLMQQAVEAIGKGRELGEALRSLMAAQNLHATHTWHGEDGREERVDLLQNSAGRVAVIPHNFFISLRDVVGGLLAVWARASAATVDSADLAPNDRRIISQVVLSALTEMYLLTGHWRAAITASQATVLHLTAPELQRAPSHIERLIVAVVDSRRAADRRDLPAHARRAFNSSAMRLHRLQHRLQSSDGEELAGYGLLAHFLGPAPLPAAMAHGAAILPLLACAEMADVAPPAAHPANTLSRPRQRLGEAVLPPPPEVSESVVFTLSSAGSISASAADVEDARAAVRHLQRTLGGSAGEAPSASAAATLRSADRLQAQLARSAGAATSDLTDNDEGSGGTPSSGDPAARAACYASAAHVDALLPAIAVDEGVLQEVATEIATPSVPEEMLPLPLTLRLPRRPPASSPRLDMAIVSLCAYNESETALARLSQENLAAYCERHGYACYLARETIDPARPPAWSKIPLLARVLAQHEWAVWRDCDSFFQNMAVRVEDVIAAALDARATIAAAAGRVIRRRRAGPATLATFARGAPIGVDSSGTAAYAHRAAATMDLIASEDGFMLNTGMFAVRNTAWSFDMLQAVYGVPPPRRVAWTYDGLRSGIPAPRLPPVDIFHRLNGEGGEVTCTGHLGVCKHDGSLRRLPARDGRVGVPTQAEAARRFGEAVQAAMLASPLPFDTNRAWEQAMVFAHLVTPVAVDDGGEGASAAVARTQMVPQQWMNAYPAELAVKLADEQGIGLHAAYAAGDWIIAFSGCGNLLGRTKCEQLYAEWHAKAGV